MRDYVLTEDQATQCLDLKAQGHSYPAIIQAAALPLSPKALAGRLETWRVTLGREPAPPYKPRGVTRHLRPVLPQQYPNEPRLAYHQRLTATGFLFCHFCHRQLQRPVLVCIKTRPRQLDMTCDQILRHLVRMGALDDDVCGCPDMLVYLEEIRYDETPTGDRVHPYARLLGA